MAAKHVTYRNGDHTQVVGDTDRMRALMAEQGYTLEGEDDPGPNLARMTKAQLVELAGDTIEDAYALTKPQLIEALEKGSDDD